VLLAQEWLRITIGIKTICTIKVDINKAYDSVRWNFLLHCLREIGTPDQFYAWVKECISTPQYYIALNVGLVGYFKGKRMLRQGVLYPHIYLS